MLSRLSLVSLWTGIVDLTITYADAEWRSNLLFGTNHSCIRSQAMQCFSSSTALSCAMS